MELNIGEKKRIAGIMKVVRLAIRLDQPVFCGMEAFECCVSGFKHSVMHGRFYSYIPIENTRIILRPELHDMNFFTCPFYEFTVNWVEGVGVETLH